MLTLATFNMLFRMALKFFGKVLFCFWLITFDARESRRKTAHFFVDLNWMHLLTKFHADQRSLRGLNVTKTDISAILNLLIFLKKLEKTTLLVSFFA